MDVELGGLRDRKCWDEEGVMEAEDARKRHADATFASLFAIMAIKNFEYDGKEHVYKARIVLGGHNIRDVDGAAVFFRDAYSIPSSMSAAAISSTSITSTHRIVTNTL